VTVAEEWWHKTCADKPSISLTQLQDVKIDAMERRGRAAHQGGGNHSECREVETKRAGNRRGTNKAGHGCRHASFDHDAPHGIFCESCHQMPVASTEFV